MVSAARLTETSATPGVAESTRSILAEQAAQCTPLTGSPDSERNLDPFSG